MFHNPFIYYIAEYIPHWVSMSILIATLIVVPIAANRQEKNDGKEGTA